MFPKRSDAILEVRQLANVENNNFVRDVEIVRMMNRRISSIYKDCITAYGNSRYAERVCISGLGYNQPNQPVIWPNTAKTISGVAQLTTTEFPMPTNFGRLLRVDWVRGTLLGTSVNGGVYYQTQQNNIAWTPMMPLDINGAIIDDSPREWIEGTVFYWLKGTPGATIFAEHDPSDVTTNWWLAFLPVPQSPVSVNIWYIPMAPQFSAVDSTDVIRLPDEAWDYVANATAAAILKKKRADNSQYLQDALTARAEIINGDIDPDEAEAAGTIDVYSNKTNERRRNVWGH